MLTDGGVYFILHQSSSLGKLGQKALQIPYYLAFVHTVEADVESSFSALPFASWSSTDAEGRREQVSLCLKALHQSQQLP